MIDIIGELPGTTREIFKRHPAGQISLVHLPEDPSPRVGSRSFLNRL